LFPRRRPKGDHLDGARSALLFDDTARQVYEGFRLRREGRTVGKIERR
jgi:hypothetical protein